jgi:hypothetical protein
MMQKPKSKKQGAKRNDPFSSFGFGMDMEDDFFGGGTGGSF